MNFKRVTNNDNLAGAVENIDGAQKNKLETHIYGNCLRKSDLIVLNNFSKNGILQESYAQKLAE